MTAIHARTSTSTRPARALIRSAFLTSALLLSTACGGGAGSSTPVAVTVDGRVAPYAPVYLSSPDLASRARTVLSGAAAVWNAPATALDGYLLVFEQTPFDCGKTGPEADEITGCTWEDKRVIQVLALGAACPEATVIAHEVGHALLGDNDHSDPRWRDPEFWDRMLVAMQHTAPGDCALERFVEFNEVR
jgi:hypothetical protein